MTQTKEIFTLHAIPVIILLAIAGFYLFFPHTTDCCTETCNQYGQICAYAQDDDVYCSPINQNTTTRYEHECPNQKS